MVSPLSVSYRGLAYLPLLGVLLRLGLEILFGLRQQVVVISLVFLTYISIVLGELYPKRIAMNLKENLAVYLCPCYHFFLEKIVSLLFGSYQRQPIFSHVLRQCNLMMRTKKMTRDEIEYMLSNSEETLDAEEIEIVTRYLFARRINGA